MTILSIETSTRVCSAALCRDGQPLEQLISREGGNHASLLPVYIEQLLRSASSQGLRIEAVALSEGPGSYTGLRIGASTAKGLCYGLGVPLIAVPTLEVLCRAAIGMASASLPPHARLCPMIDARRMEVYTALFAADGQPLVGEATRAVVVENPASITGGREDGTVCFFGDGADKCRSVLTGNDWFFLPDIVPEAQYMDVLAEKRIADGQGLTLHQMAYYEPFYLKEFVAAESHVKGLV